jgi:hypothetical protein
MELQRQIDIKNAYLQLIRDIAVDYDGATNVEDFIILIDEMNAYAKYALDNNDTEVIYENYISDGRILKENVLMENIDF